MTLSLPLPGGFLPIANHLWQSTVFAGIAGLLTLLLRNNRAHARYCLWLAASAKFLVPFSLLMLVGGLIGGLAGRHSVAVPAPTRVPVIVEQMNEPFVAEVPPGAVVMPRASKSETWVAPMLVVLWATGCAALVFSWWMRWRRMRVAVRTGSPVPLGIGIPALSSASIIEPGVFGVFRPVLLLPEGIGDRLAPAELQAILAHELCHVRRRDNLATMMHMVVEAVFWFHPLVWWLGARLMDERERACDEEVLRMGSEAEAYTEGILKVCELYLQSPLKCIAGVMGANLKRRIEAIMANRPILSLNLTKKVGLALAGILAVAIPVILGITNAPELRAQAQSVPKPPPAPKMMAADADPVFEVATIKPGDPNRRRLFSIQSTEVATFSTTVNDLIVFAYGVHAGQISGAPAWVESDKFDIRGKPEGGGRPNPTQFKTMLQKLLADRFQVAFHRDKKQLAVYGLTVGKGGPKLTRSEAGSPIPNLIPRGPGNLPARNATMEEFAGVMQSHLDRPVIDQTGLEGRFDFQLQWTPDEFTTLGGPGESPKPPEGAETQPDLFTAVQEQLGLKLASIKAQVDVLVIDKVEKPSEN